MADIRYNHRIKLIKLTFFVLFTKNGIFKLTKCGLSPRGFCILCSVLKHGLKFLKNVKSPPHALPVRSSTQIWVVTHHQYGISALVSQTSFCGETVGGVAKCQLFPPARSTWDISCYYIIGQEDYSLARLKQEITCRQDEWLIRTTRIHFILPTCGTSRIIENVTI